MLVVPKFMNYERPGEYEPGNAQVLVPQNVIRHFGEVAVNYDSLSEFFRELKQPAEKSTVVLYYSGKFGEGVLPKGIQHTPHIPFSKTWHINTWKRFFYPTDIHGATRPGPANVMGLLTDRMFHSVGVDTYETDYSDLRRVHDSDILFEEFNI